jgi:ankyrin repeat protein
MIVALLSSCKKQPQYSIIKTRWHLRNYVEYLENLRMEMDSDFPYAPPPFEGNYPPSVRSTEGGSTVFVVSEEYRLPFGEMSGPDERFAWFMYDGFRHWRRSDGMMIQYISNGESYILDSCGPDEVYEHEWLEKMNKQMDSLTRQQFLSEAVRVTYDPTNGVYSRGDIIVTSKNLDMPIEDIESLGMSIEEFHDWNNYLRRELLQRQVLEAKKLIASGSNLNKRDVLGGGTILLRAADEGNTEAVRLLLEHGADGSVKNDQGIAPLMVACKGGHWEVADMLFDYDVDVNERDAKGNTALHWVCKDTVRRKSRSYRRSKHEEKLERQLIIAKELIAKGANVNAANNEGETPLNWAAYYRREKIRKLLMRNGANVDKKTKDGRKPRDFELE